MLAPGALLSAIDKNAEDESGNTGQVEVGDRVLHTSTAVAALVTLLVLSGCSSVSDSLWPSFSGDEPSGERVAIEPASAEGNPAPTVDQMAKDVTAFMVWASEPTLERRHAAGLAVVVYLLIATIIAYFAYRNVWATEKRKVRVTGALDPKNIAKSRRAKAKQGVAG